MTRDDSHVRVLNELFAELCSRGLEVPKFDPKDGGVNAQALFLLETPGPKAIEFVSCDNHDPTAGNMKYAWRYAGFSRSKSFFGTSFHFASKSGVERQ